MRTIKELPIGSRIREQKSGTIFLVADHNHAGWNGTTLVSDKVCLISCIDAAEPNNPDDRISKNGNNRYAHSNINQWLNSDKETWYAPMHEYDNAPSEDFIVSRQDVFSSKLFDPDGTFPAPYAYDNIPGYLSRFESSFIDLLEDTVLPCFGPSDPDIIHYGPPSAEEITCRVFIPSADEIGLEDEVRWEGYLIRLFRDARMKMCAPEPDAIHREKDFIYKQSAVACWLRSPVGNTSSMGKIYQAEHKFGDVVGAALMPHPVNYVAGIRPIMNIRDKAIVSDRDADGIYNITGGSN